MIHIFAARFPRKPAAYFFLFIAWIATLWLLSSGNPAPKGGPQIPHLDKLCHFTYFAAGGGLLALLCGLKWRHLSYSRVFIICLIICSVIGRLDEYHQSFTAGRTGNDTGDWLADTLGGAAGALFILKFFLPQLTSAPPNHRKESKKQV